MIFLRKSNDGVQARGDVTQDSSGNVTQDSSGNLYGSPLREAPMERGGVGDYPVALNRR